MKKPTPSDLLLRLALRIASLLLKTIVTNNVSLPQLILLSELEHVDFLSMTDISKKFGHSTAAATGMVDRVEKLGYVQRIHDQDDRRKVLVILTQKGSGFLEDMAKAIHKELPDNHDTGMSIRDYLVSLSLTDIHSSLKAS